MHNILKILNNSKLFSAIIMILVNLGSKHLVKDVPQEIDNILASPIFRRIIVFCIVFMATKDIITSLMVTILFIIMFSHLFNKKSKICILKSLDINGDGIISDDELFYAENILRRYREQKLHNSTTIQFR